MSLVQQTAGGQNDGGVILTIGILSNGYRSEIVTPYYTFTVPVTAVDKAQFCQCAVAGWLSSQGSLLQACMSSDAQITFVAACGMVDGLTPYRTDFPLT